MGWDSMKGYKPESPKEGGSGFEAFKYEGPVVINKAIVSVNETVDSEFYPKGCNQIEIEAEVQDGEFARRKLWKRFNLDDAKMDKKGKTSVMKLADQLWAVGLEFSDLDSLKAACEKLASMTINIKAWPVDFKEGGRSPVQMWNIKSVATEKWTETATTGKPLF